MDIPNPNAALVGVKLQLLEKENCALAGKLENLQAVHVKCEQKHFELSRELAAANETNSGLLEYQKELQGQLTDLTVQQEMAFAERSASGKTAVLQLESERVGLSLLKMENVCEKCENGSRFPSI